MANIDNILEQKNRQLQNLEDELITLEKKAEALSIRTGSFEREET